uniref:Putative DNA binding, helix-turn-helix domain containing protein n=1 Tax=viral metagenome TaxID=1070528 RepID=A0A6M3M6V3_9ZZZZ
MGRRRRERTLAEKKLAVSVLFGRLRREAGLRIEDVAGLSGCSRTYVWRLDAQPTHTGWDRGRLRRVFRAVRGRPTVEQERPVVADGDRRGWVNCPRKGSVLALARCEEYQRENGCGDGCRAVPEFEEARTTDLQMRAREAAREQYRRWGSRRTGMCAECGAPTARKDATWCAECAKVKLASMRRARGRRTVKPNKCLDCGCPVYERSERCRECFLKMNRQRMRVHAARS